MRKSTLRLFLGGVAGISALAGAVFVVWLFSLPSSAAAIPQPPISAEEIEATLLALQPPKRERPVIAIVGINDATETTDYLVPYGILRRADVADVFALATEAGVVELYPALTVEPDATIAEFDQRYAEGADYVIVPAMSRNDDPIALEWIRQQAEMGATVIGVCRGAQVVAASGLLDGKRATTHWFSLNELRSDHPSVFYLRDRRLVVDQRVATTTGITASMPMMLTLVEAIAGREKAEEVADDLGISHWDARHDSSAFAFTRPFATTIAANVLAFWNRETLGIELTEGMDEVSLALVADAWSRTYRSQVLAFSRSAAPATTLGGIQIVPDAETPAGQGVQLLSALADLPPARALEETLRAIERRYGGPTADVVAMELEFPREPGTSGV